MKTSEKSKVGAGLVSARKEKGITLVALIITIIVMLILVGVSAQVVINSNLIETAQDAADRTKTEYEEEGSMDEITVGNTTYRNIDEYIESTKQLPEGAGERFETTGEYSDGSEKAVIPGGFTVSGVRSEARIDRGLVIYLIPEGTTVDWTDETAVANAQKTYDQFVWIPIKNTTDENAQDINDMYICQGKTGSNGTCTIIVQNGVATCTNVNHSAIVQGTTTNKNTLMAGRLYATEKGENFEKAYKETYTSGSGLREPDTLSSSTYAEGNSSNLEFLQNILGTRGYDTEANFKTSLQTEYNEVVKSVYENQGFYVGRYETTNMTSNNGTAVKVVSGTTTGISGIEWYYMYAQQKDYAINKGLTTSIGSTMIQGAAYDQVMKFVNTTSNSVTTAGNVGHSTEEGAGSVYQTGGLNYSAQTESNAETYIPYNDVSKNIFDLEGNVCIWTTEGDSTSSRVIRGGDYDTSNSASCRYRSGPNGSNDGIGSLCQLYVK